MKVAYITTKFPVPSETFASSDVKSLHELGVDVSVYAQRGWDRNASQMIQERQLEDIPITSCGKKEIVLGFFLMLIKPLLTIRTIFWILKNGIDKPWLCLKSIFLLPSSFFILRKLKAVKPDVVHLFWGHYPAIVGYLVKKRLLDVKLSVFLGAYDVEYKMGISKDVCAKADSIFTHSKSNLDALREQGINTSDVKVVYRGVPVNKLLPNNSEVVGASKQKNSWLSAGRLLESKGFGDVLKNFSGLGDINQQLIIAGDGPDREKLNAAAIDYGIQNRVTFLGHVPHSALFGKMLASEYFILLSRKKGERLPNALKEAMLAGCICLASRTLGIEELICDGVNGFIVDEAGVSVSMKKLLILTDNEKELIRVAAKRTISEKFDAKNSMRIYTHIWNDLI